MARRPPLQAAPEPKKRQRLTRDVAVVAFSLAFAAYEIVVGGARPSVLTFLGGLLLSPLVLRYDESKRNE